MSLNENNQIEQCPQNQQQQQQSQMQASKQLEQSTDQFEQLNEEILTYTLSHQASINRADSYDHKKKKKPTEKPKLELVSSVSQNRREAFSFEISKTQKKKTAQFGKILKIGSVTFRSNFECGNIQNVEQIASSTYRVSMEKEVNSLRTSAWFFFCCEGLKGEVSFVIQGFTKGHSLYNEGMKLCIRQGKDGKWRRGGSKISYDSVFSGQQQTGLYQLKFTHFFKSNEVCPVEIAYCFPYGLKKLSAMINEISHASRCQSLGKSYDGRDIPMLTIGNQASQKVMILSARVHPGETVSSFIMEGFLRQLVSASEYGCMLRELYLFKIVPMINPDGVVRGNYRFSTSGYDLNRKWKNCKVSEQPEICLIRQMIRRISKEKEVVMFIDMHGHSRKKNVFFYGCCQSSNGEINSKPKEFPFFMEKIHDAYKYDYCAFSMQKDKEGTARITMWKELKINYVYTLESSFCGNVGGPNYLEADYLKIGKKLCEGIAAFFYDQNQLKKTSNSLKFKILEKASALKINAEEELKSSVYLLNVGAEDNSGSDSQPQKGQIPENERIFERDTAKTSQSFVSSASVKHQKPSVATLKAIMKFTPKTIHKLKSQTTNNEELKMHFQSPANQINKQFMSKMDKIDIKVSNNVNTYEFQVLKSQCLYQKNVRVHSLSRNVNRPSMRLSQFEEEDNEQRCEKLKINLMHAREGVQYRRVRKIAELNYKQNLVAQPQPTSMVRGLQNTKLQIDKCKTIAPRFYPISQNRNRRTSAETYFRKNSKMPIQLQNKRISINGDQLNVRCLGNRIYF